MRGVFDDQEIALARPSRDAELTLGSGALLVIAGGLLLLCGIFFGMGYAVGHRGSAPEPAKLPQAATEREPLQASGNIPKPSAIAQIPVPQAQASDDADPSIAEPDTAATPSSGAVVSLPAGVAAQSEVHPALAGVGTSQYAAAGATQAVHPALSQPPMQQFMVQIASVANAGDAEALVNALKQRNYPVLSKREPADKFIHVRIGPFASRQIADQWKMKLLNDGYNAQVEP